MNLLRASIFNFECLDKLRDSVGHPSWKLLRFAFATSFRFQLRASRYITRLHLTSKLKFIVVWICYELPFSITSVSAYYEMQSNIRVIYYGIHSDIRVKRHCRFILVRASVLNFERLNILRVTMGNLNKKLLSFEFAHNFCFQIRASWYITALNRTSELNVIVVWICYELQFWFWRISIYYVTQTDIRVKSYCRLNFLRTSVLNFELLDILRVSIWHPS